MAYLLNLHGKWINKCGKILFSYPEEVQEYIKKIIQETLPFLVPLYGIKNANRKINLSYTVYMIEESSPLREKFKCKTVTDQEIFIPKKKDGKPKPTEEDIGIMESHDERRENIPKRNRTGKYFNLKRLQDNVIHEYKEREDDGPRLQVSQL